MDLFFVLLAGWLYGVRTDEVEFRQENVPVARFQDFARPSLQGRGRGSRSERQSHATPTRLKNWNPFPLRLFVLPAMKSS